MGAFGMIQRETRDPTLKNVDARFTMADEAAHHKFGKIWADKTIPKLTEEEHEAVENVGGRVLPGPPL